MDTYIDHLSNKLAVLYQCILEENIPSYLLSTNFIDSLALYFNSLFFSFASLLDFNNCMPSTGFDLCIISNSLHYLIYLFVYLILAAIISS